MSTLGTAPRCAEEWPALYCVLWSRSSWTARLIIPDRADSTLLSSSSSARTVEREGGGGAGEGGVTGQEWEGTVGKTGFSHVLPPADFLL